MSVIPPNQTPQSGLEILKGRPMIDRVIFSLDMLEKLKTQNLRIAHQPAITRTQQDNSFAAKGKAKAYHDTSVFLAQIFQDELREHLLPIEEPT